MLWVEFRTDTVFCGSQRYQRKWVKKSLSGYVNALGEKSVYFAGCHMYRKDKTVDTLSYLRIFVHEEA